jgi:hypothetical protein
LSRRFLLTLATTAWLVGLYFLYARYVSPLVEPSQLAGEPSASAPAAAGIEREATTSEHLEVAKAFLPNQDWAKTADNRYRVGDMFLYAMVVEQLNDRAEIKFRPFAMVWKNPNAKPGDPPVRITAESAVLRFEAAFNLDSQQSGGRPVFGSLEGNVEIDGPNGLKLTGRDFTFSEEALKLWSDSDILFHYGPHRGTGHGLQVDFLPASDTNAVPDMPKLAGVRSVSLLRQVILDLSGEAPAAKTAAPAVAMKPVEKIHVTSDGRLQYDLESNLITIEQNVRVLHPQPAGAREGLNCDLLTLVVSSDASRAQLNPAVSNSKIELASNEDLGAADHVQIPGAVPAAAAKPGGFENWLPDHLQLEKLLADGAGKRRVEMFSAPREMHGNTGQIEYDLTQRVVFLRDPNTVDIMQGPHELHAPELMLKFAENNRDVTFAVARGVGNAISRLTDGRVFSASWHKQLIKSIDSRSGLDLVELQGSAKVALDTEYELAGDALRLWMTPAAAESRPAENATPKRATENSVPQIERVAGVGQVVLKSPQATAHNEWLDVRFQTVALPPEVPGEAKSLFNLDPAEGQTDRASSPARSGQKPRAAAPRQPLDLKSQRMLATVFRDRIDPARLVLSDMTAEGTVNVSQSVSADPRQPPMTMTGHILTVKNVSPIQQLVKLQGVPATANNRGVLAQIQSGAAHVEGPVIDLDRRANTLAVTGAGVLEYPMRTSLEGQPLERPQLLRVQWLEALKFDGKTADFFEKVEASLDQTTMRCNAMHVTLVKPIRFDSPDLKNNNAQNMQLARIFCENRVEVVTCEYQKNVVISRGSGRLGQFAIDNVSGKTEAQGPGFFMRWTLGQERPGAPAAGANRTPKKAPQRAAAAGWTYSRIDFQGRMKGNIQERTATFEDHVEMIYGPVLHATDRIDVDNLPEGGAAMTCDSLTVSQFAATETDPPHLLFFAQRNTKLDMLWEGKPLYGTADEVKYDESKDSYLLRSNGDRKVVISKEPTADNLDATIRCARVEICPSLKRLRILNATNIGVQQ